jgi:glycosyltransferase involved in cell wall biosynthesis
VTALVTARNEADRIEATIRALKDSLPGAQVIVADDGSRDDTSLIAMRAGAEVVARGRRHGKGGAASAGAEAMLSVPEGADDALVVLCDGDLGSSAARLADLVRRVADDECDIAIAIFTRKQGGGFGIARGFASWAIRNLTGFEARAPISGQRAMTVQVLRDVLPFAAGFGMEIGMTVDALRAGYRLAEVELDLDHRATGRSASGFVHRGRQLLDFSRAYVSRRLARK